MGGAIARSNVIDENVRLQEETLEMKRQLETRKFVERAKGLLQSKYKLTEEEAYLRLRNESRRLRRPMRELAEAIILAEELAGSNGSPAPVERNEIRPTLRSVSNEKEY
jgi:AmiR/NasT family two-component response regulator